MSYVSRYELNTAYEDCIDKKRSTENAIKFEINENENIENLYKKLNIKQYDIGKSIVFTLWNKEKQIAYREVFAADFKDRIVHHLFINRIYDYLEKYEFIDDAYACIKGKGTLYGAKRCQQQMQQAYDEYGDKCYILKGDFKNFFNTLNKDILFNEFKKFLYEHEDKNIDYNIWLLEKIIYHCPQNKGNYIRKQPKRFWNTMKPEKSMFNLDNLHGIAVGNLTSQIFANFLLSKIDHYIKDVLGYKYYGRYVDDFFIISNDKEKLKQDYKKLIEYVKIFDLEINTSKLYLQPIYHGVNFIGYTIYKDRLYIMRKTLYKFEQIINKLNNNECKKLIKNNKNISVLEANNIINTWNSYVGLLSHTDNKDYYKKLLDKYKGFSTIMLNVCDITNQGMLKLNKQSKKLLKLYYCYNINKIKYDKKGIL